MRTFHAIALAVALLSLALCLLGWRASVSGGWDDARDWGLASALIAIIAALDLALLLLS